MVTVTRPIMPPVPPLVRSGQLKIEGHRANDQSVSVDAMVRLLEGIQQTALLIAASTEPTVSAVKRFRASDELRRRSEIRVEAIQPGSVIVPLREREPAAASLLPKVHAFLAAVSVGNVARMTEVIPDSFYRERAVRTAAAFLPRAGDGWTAVLSTDDGGLPPVKLDRQAKEVVDRLIEGVWDPDEIPVVGQLTNLNFAKERVVINYAPKDRQISCPYPFDSEDRLFDSRRRLVKVIGVFERDSEGHPKKCIRARVIEPFDLSPILLSEVQLFGRTLAIDPALNLTPEQDEESRGAVLYAADDSLSLHVYAKDRDSLIREAQEYLAFLWDAYGNADDAGMTADAVELAQAVRARITELPGEP